MNTLPIGLIGDVGGGEILLIAAAILMLFGGKRLPSIARTIGKTVADLRRASQDFKDQLLNAAEPPSDDIAKPAHKITLNTSDTTQSTPHASLTPSKEIPPHDPAG